MKHPLKSILPLAVAAAIAIPAAGQIPVPPLPHVEIHVAHSHPPHLRHEVRGVRPGHEYVWIGGFWDWQGADWVWIPGRWARPEGEHVRWVHPRYVHEYGSYRYEPGHWSNQHLQESDEYHRWREEHHGHHHDDHHDDHGQR